jgi:predicted aldo/keto reductase-like oxidoreductase
MQYRSFPKAPGLAVSTLGLGCGRLPTIAGEPARIDEAAATSLVRAAIDAGVNYLDSAASHHGGQCEPFLGRALAGGWREKVHLAAKLPLWLAREEADWGRLLDAQLERLATDHVELCLLQALTGERWKAVQRLGGLRALDRARADGRIGRVGFSFDGALADLEAILDGYDWDACELELNFLDEPRQVGREGLRRAASRRVGVIVAEPLRGGALARPPPVVQDAWARSDRGWTAAGWALRWAWDHAEVITAVSSPSSAAELREGVDAARAAAPLSARDLERMEDARRIYRTRRRVPCTTCGSCLPCPSGVAIPHVLSLYNDAMFDAKEAPIGDYERLFLDRGAGADRCTACGECELKCPERIPLVERVCEAHAYLTA